MQFKALGEALLKSGIAPRHVHRYLAELSEHHQDLMAEQRAKGYDAEDAAIRARARLGSDDELADAMLSHKQFRSWVARAPIAVFCVLPPAVTLLAAFAVMTPLVFCARLANLLGHDGIYAREWFRILVSITLAFGNFALTPALALAFVWTARRQRLCDLWPLLAIGLIALVDLQFQAHFPALGRQDGEVGISAGMWLHPDQFWDTWRLAAVQLFLTLLPVSWLLQRKVVKR